LGAKLILFGTLVTVAAVCAGFFVVSIEIRKRTKALLAETVAHHQSLVLKFQQERLEEVLRTSSLLTDSPTLRAAMETYQLESGPADAGRADLLETIRNEAAKVAAGLSRDLLIVTDREGRVLAASGSGPRLPSPGEDLASRAIVRQALAETPARDQGNFAILDLEGDRYQAGGAPIVLQGYLIGALILGEHIDQQFVEGLRDSFESDFAVLIDRTVVVSTLGEARRLDGDLRSLVAKAGAAPDGPVVASLGREEFVTAALPLGTDGAGHGATLLLLHSLTEALTASNRSLRAILVSCGAAAVLLTACAAWWMSRSVLRPLDDFVRFMRAVAVSADHGRRFQSSASCAEVDTLADAYHHLMASLQAHEERMLQSAREDLDRLARLKESEKLATLGRMLSGAAHEINNPLAGVVGNLELLLRSEGLDGDARARLERIHANGLRVVSLVRSLLRVSHRDTGERATIDLRDLLRQTVEMRRHDFATAGIELKVDLDSQPVRVDGSALELEQVFLNIVNNGFDALSEGTPAPRLSARAFLDHDHATVVLEDNGPGMKQPERVFEHFYTTKRVGQGTGLGLSICDAIVREHGGRIWAENRAQGGARFTIALPAAREEAATRVASVVPAVVVPTGSRLDVSVLVVDDEPTLVELQREILESLGASVVGAASGSEAVAVLERRSFDLVVSDLKMPGAVSGQDLFHWIESQEPPVARGFVFVTGDTAGDLNRDSLERAGARFLWKPFSVAEYVAALREASHETQGMV